MKQTLTTLTPLLVVFTVLLSSHFIDAAWIAPSGQPSADNNAPAPINVSAENQLKLGDITALNLKAGSQMWSAEYCDENGLNCFDPATGSTSSVSGDFWFSSIPTSAMCESDTGTGRWNNYFRSWFSPQELRFSRVSYEVTDRGVRPLAHYTSNTVRTGSYNRTCSMKYSIDDGMSDCRCTYSPRPRNNTIRGGDYGGGGGNGI